MASDVSVPRRGVSSAIEFERGLRPLAVFLLASILVFVSVPVVLFPLSSGPLTTMAVIAFGFALVGALAVLALRAEGVSAADVGLGRANVLPGVLAVAGLYVAVNVAGAVYLALVGESVRLALPPRYSTTLNWAVAGVVYLVFNGIAEELGYRAYLQNKLVAMLDASDDRFRKAAAILIGVFVFTLVHIPQRVFIMGLTSPGAILGTFVSVVVLGTILGLLYEYTRNVVLVGVLHGTFNWDPVVVAGVPGDVQLLVGVPLLVGVAWYYRRWASETRVSNFRSQQQARTAG
jgi:membrane protease YdiL (CAAX protease family)